MTEKQEAYKNIILADMKERVERGERRFSRTGKYTAYYPIAKKVLDTNWDDDNLQLLISIYRSNAENIDEMNHFLTINNYNYSI